MNDRPSRPIEVLDREEIDFEVEGADFRAIIQIERIAGKSNSLTTWGIHPLSNGVELPIVDWGSVYNVSSHFREDVDKDNFDRVCLEVREAAEDYLPDEEDLALDPDERIIRGEVNLNE